MLSNNLLLNERKGDVRMNPEIEKQVGENIRRLRKRAKMTQDMLASKMQLEGCDITRSSIAKIEVGMRHVYPDELILIRNILHVSYEDLLKV